MMKSNLFLKKNSATILTVAAAAGVITTSVLSAKAAIRASRVLAHKEEEKGEELTFEETISAIWTIYIPPIVAGVSTIACVFGANILNQRQQASLASAYALIDSSYKEYKAKLKELYGEEAHNNIIDAIAAKKCEDVYISAGGLESAYNQEKCTPKGVHSLLIIPYRTLTLTTPSIASMSLITFWGTTLSQSMIEYAISPRFLSSNPAMLMPSRLIVSVIVAIIFG